MAFVVVSVAAASGCMQEADRDTPAMQDLLEGADQRERQDDAFDIALEQGREAGAGSFDATLTDEEQDCLYDHPDLADIDLRRILTDPAAGEDRVALVAALLSCLPDPATHDGLIAMFEGNLELAAPQLDLSRDESGCMLGRILSESADPARTMVLFDQADDLDLFLDAASDCLTSENLGILTGAEGSGPQSYGDDPRFDGMVDDCEAGLDRACDLLYLQASVGSDYADIAATCAGRLPEGDAFCAPESELGPNGFAPDGSPGLPVLAADCEDGDLTACDLLFWLSPQGGEFEDVGYTCGGRVVVGAVPDCRTRLG